MNFKVVIGANFGDEGKGQVTDFLCHQALSEGKTCLVVLSNGGAQRGHTVNTPEGKSHVFHHFGSGSFLGVDTLFPHTYILNPMTFYQEHRELLVQGIRAFPYCNKQCRWSTPWDMMVNQIIEWWRGENRHGSCGMGIWETIERYRSCVDMPIHSFASLPYEDQKARLKKLRDTYFVRRLQGYGIGGVPKDWQNIFFSEALVDNFVQDVLYLASNTRPVERDNAIFGLYNTVIFENGQGLLLDGNNGVYGDHTTPSSTGQGAASSLLLYAPSNLNSIEYQVADFELCFVSRTYMTRHGAGEFFTETNKDNILPGIEDDTNKYNEFQGEFRYGHLDPRSLLDRLEWETSQFGRIFPTAHSSLFLTHTNELAPDPLIFNTREISSFYLSDGRTRESFKKA